MAENERAAGRLSAKAPQRKKKGASGSSGGALSGLQRPSAASPAVAAVSRS
ncbi:hypothetical protein ACIP4T_36665 [Streptomyces massasporeus]|uniref:hypothetical protein n=1 Tax=Streptomyces massasporeus TaxID=67324 RepID=UPI0036C2F903